MDLNTIINFGNEMINKLDMKTKNLNEENLLKIMEDFPSCISERIDENGNIKKAIDFDVLKQELSCNIIEDKKERYSLNWPGKRDSLIMANKPTNKTLRPNIEDSVNFDDTKNLYIEGDNLDALKLLQESYLNKIKMIYIDPPYNTGNDFIYEDDYSVNQDVELESSGQQDSDGGKLVSNPDSSGRYHSDWLSMIYPRLKLARKLLQNDGVIFISIDENEIFNLRHVCNDVFGEDNFLTEIVVKVRHEERILKGDKDFHETYEYCLVYRKSMKYKQSKKLVDNKSIDKYIYSVELIGEPDEEIMCDNKKVLVYSPEKYNLVKNTVANENYFQSINIRGSLKEGNSSGRFYMKHLDGISDKYGYLYKVPNIGNDKFDHRFFMKPKSEKYANGTYFQGIPLDKKDIKEVPYPNFFDFTKEFNNVGYEGEVEYRNGKKPIEFLQKLLEIAGINEERNATVLDFFSGSSSTAEAIMKINYLNDTNNKYIMVQLDENLDESLLEVSGTTKSTIEKTIKFLDEIDKPHILSELGKERIRRSGKKIVEESGNTDLDIGFRVFKIDSSNMNDIYYSPDEISQETLFETTVYNIKEDRNSLDLLFQVLLDSGVDLTLPIEKKEVSGKEVYFVDGNVMVACFEDNIDEALVTEIARMEDILKVVFKDSSFESDDVRINTEQIFKEYSPDTDLKVI